MKLWHIGYLTDDIERSLSEICGAIDIDQVNPVEITFTAKEVSKGTPFTVKCANVPFEGVVYEFVQPVNCPDCFLTKELSKRGRGMHHAAFELRARYDGAVAELVSRGWTLEMAACKDGARSCFLLSPDESLCYELIDNIPE